MRTFGTRAWHSVGLDEKQATGEDLVKGGMSDLLRMELYRSMRRIRRVEEALIAEYHPADEMRCPIHFCVGQEATPAVLGLKMSPEDIVGSHYRSHGYYLAKGAPLAGMVAEFYGRQSGSNGGIGGSMELAHHDSQFYSGAIVGGSTGLAVGSAFAQKYLGQAGITISVFGDGAMDEGVVYEAINLAVIKELPVLFICENNKYAVYAPLSARTRAPDLARRAAAFGIESIRLEDGDPEGLYLRLSPIVDRVRAQRKPFFVEVDTYRYCGHVGPEGDDDVGYRTLSEIATRREADPLEKLHGQLLARGNGNHLADVDAEIDAEIAAAIAAARRAPFPSVQWAASIVTSGTYDPVVSSLVDGDIGHFVGGQSEAKLAPY